MQRLADVYKPRGCACKLVNTLRALFLQTLTVLVVVFSAVLGGLQRHTVSPLDLTQQRGGPRVDEKCHNCLDFGEKYLKDLFEIITSK